MTMIFQDNIIIVQYTNIIPPSPKSGKDMYIAHPSRIDAHGQVL